MGHFTGKSPPPSLSLSVEAGARLFSRIPSVVGVSSAADDLFTNLSLPLPFRSAKIRPAKPPRAERSRQSHPSAKANKQNQSRRHMNEPSNIMFILVLLVH